MKTDNDPRSTEEITAEAFRLMRQTTQYLVEAIGDGSFSMTDATQAIWGSSGRGNPRAVRQIEVLAEYGFVKIVGPPRRRRVLLTQKGLECGTPDYNV